MIQKKSAKEIIVEALCINFGEPHPDSDVLTIKEPNPEPEKPGPASSSPEFEAAVDKERRN